MYSRQQFETDTLADDTLIDNQMVVNIGYNIHGLYKTNKITYTASHSGYITHHWEKNI